MARHLLSECYWSLDAGRGRGEGGAWRHPPWQGGSVQLPAAESLSPDTPSVQLPGRRVTEHTSCFTARLLHAASTCASLTWWYSRAGAGVPTACTTIEEVGSTGVGALTVGFIIFAVCTVVFLAKANTSGEQRKCVTLSFTPAHLDQWGSQESRHSEAAKKRARAVHEGSCWKTMHRICAKQSARSQSGLLQ